MMLGGPEEASDTGVRSVRPCVGGAGKVTFAPLEAVRRRRCVDMSCEVEDLMLSEGASIVPVSTNETSALSLLLVSLLATLTLMSSSNDLRPGVMGDGRGDACSVVATLAVSTGDGGGNGSSGENSDGVGMWCGIVKPPAGESWWSDQASLVELSRRWPSPTLAS